MDKETLSNYGWIVVLVLILVVMMALAGPFGNFVADGIKSTTVGFWQTSEKALNTSNVPVAENKWQEGTGGAGEKGNEGNTNEETIDTPLYFGKIYVHYYEDKHVNGLDIPYESYIFNQDGSVIFTNFNGTVTDTKNIPSGFVTYEEGFIVITPPPGYGEAIKFPISTDKKTVEFMNADGSQTLTFTLTDSICTHPNKTTQGATEHCPDCNKSGCNHCNQTQDKHGNVTCPDCGDTWIVPV